VVNSENHRSTRLSQLEPVETKCNWNLEGRASHRLMAGLVRGVVVGDEVDVELLGHLGVDALEEILELDAPVPLVQPGDDGAVEGGEGGEDRRGAVTGVVVKSSLGRSGKHGQDGLEAVERLDLGLLVDGEHDGVHGRVEVEPDHVFDLTMKSGSVESLKFSARLGWRLKAPQIRCTLAGEIPTTSANERVDQLVESLGISLRGPDDHVFDLLVTDGAGHPGAVLVLETLEALGHETAAPLSDGCGRDPQLPWPPRGSMLPPRTPARCPSAGPDAVRSRADAPIARGSPARPR
jgi:hypothetical protein